MSTNINGESIDVFCKMLMDAIKVNPDAKPGTLIGEYWRAISVAMSSDSALIKPNVRTGEVYAKLCSRIRPNTCSV